MTSEELASLSAGIPVQVIPGFTSMQPWRKRSGKIDLETKLIRKPPIKPMHEGQQVDRDAAEGVYARKKRTKAALAAEWE